MLKAKVRSDKKINVNPNLPKDTHDKLYKLAISCGMTKTKLAERIITMIVNDPDAVNYFQDKYNTEPQYRITPIIIGDRVQF